MNILTKNTQTKLKVWVFFMFFRKVKSQINRLNNNLEKSNLLELSYILSSKKELIKRNLLAGVFRGIGIGIGVTIVTALIILTLQRIVRLNVPVIGDFIVQIIEVVQNKTTY